MRLLFVSCLSICGIIAASAQERMQLTVNDAVSIALENSKMLHASLMKTEAAEGKASETRSARLPSVKLSGGYTRVSPITPFEFTLPGSGQTFTISPSIVDNYSLKASLAQPLFTGFRLQGSQNLAELNAEATHQDYGRDRADLIFNTKSAYWGLLRAIELKRSIDTSVAQVQAHVTDAENLLEQGLATTNDVLKLRVQLSNAELLQIQAENAIRIGIVTLNNLMNIPLETVVQPVSSLETVEHDTTAHGTLITTALAQRPEVKGMEFRVRAGEAGVTVAKSGWYPQVSLFADYVTAKPNARIVPAVQLFRDTWDVGVSFSLDVWNWLTTAHQTSQATAQLAQTQDMLSTLKDGVALEVTQSYIFLHEAHDRIGVALTAVQQAEENYRTSYEKYREGLLLTSDLLDANSDLLRARVSHTQALVDYEIGLARLERSIGKAQ
jgi:outer membrane protein